MSILKLGSHFDDCPVPWQNMINHLQDYTDSWGQTHPATAIAAELKKHNAVWNIDNDDSYVKFDTVEDKLIYVLTWS